MAQQGIPGYGRTGAAPSPGYVSDQEPLVDRHALPGGPTPPLMKLHFAAAVCIAVSGAYGAFYCVVEDFQPLDMLQLLYLSAFGLMMAVLDMPVMQHVRWVQDVRGLILKYLNLVTRQVGKGLTFVFLGTTIFASLWVNEVSYALNVIVSIVIIGTGAVTTWMGVVKMRKLENARKKIAGDAGTQSSTMIYQQYARDPRDGLLEDELNKLLNERSGTSLAPRDLNSIFVTLASDPRCGRMTFEDFDAWLKTSWTLL